MGSHMPTSSCSWCWTVRFHNHLSIISTKLSLFLRIRSYREANHEGGYGGNTSLVFRFAPSQRSLAAIQQPSRASLPRAAPTVCPLGRETAVQFEEAAAQMRTALQRWAVHLLASGLCAPSITYFSPWRYEQLSAGIHS